MYHVLSGPATADEYDRDYRLWVERKGQRALNLDWRLTHLQWGQRALLRRHSPAGKRVLDFGCLDGIFTIRLQQLGGEAVGYDISPAAIAQAKVFRGTDARPVFTTVPPGPGQFDLIYCTEVLQRPEDDSGLIGELTGYLAVGGSVVGTTPVVRSSADAPADRPYDHLVLKRVLAPWGQVRVHRYYRTPLRNLVPLRAKSAAILLFEVTPPSPPGAR
jgi:2-polyprenyl-3-methyl-5-hydroxy-6-metoxy-1,4-benzoquinol methylase